jgi:hypothetical protein
MRDFYMTELNIVVDICNMGTGLLLIFFLIRDSITALVWAAEPVTIVPLIGTLQTYIYANRR